MATHKAQAEISGSNSGSSQDYLAERSSNSKETDQCHVGKALVHRALFGSSRRRAGGRKVRTNDTARTSPSRLSRVSLADDEAEK